MYSPFNPSLKTDSKTWILLLSAMKSWLKAVVKSVLKCICAHFTANRDFKLQRCLKRTLMWRWQKRSEKYHITLPCPREKQTYLAFLPSSCKYVARTPEASWEIEPPLGPERRSQRPHFRCFSLRLFRQKISPLTNREVVRGTVVNRIYFKWAVFNLLNGFAFIWVFWH